MNTSDFELLETLREETIDGFPSCHRKRCELLIDLAQDLFAAAERATFTTDDYFRVIEVAANTVNLAGDANTIAYDLLDTIDWALETGKSIEEVGEELLAHVERIIDVSWGAQGSCEDLMLLVRGAIPEE